MKKNPQAVNSVSQPDAWGKLLLILAILIGGWLRFIPVLKSTFPINDGGMFYTLIDDLLKNNFTLPTSTTYNQMGIPFAYPPLGFYVAAGLKQLFDISPIVSISWIPPLAATLCIVAVYQLAYGITHSSIKAGVSTLCYALVPLSSTWLLMGGGLTRALGMLFLLQTVHSADQLFNSQNKFGILKTILWGSLTVLSHPEMTIQAIGISLLFLLLSLNSKNLMAALKVCAGVILLTSPWWFRIIQTNGLDPFLQAPKTGFYNLFWVLDQFGLLKMAIEENLTIVSLAGILGMVIVLAKKEVLFPLLLFVPYIANPRNANTVAIVPLSILAAIGILDVIIPALKNFAIPRKGWITLISYLLLVSMVGSYGKMMEFAETNVTGDNQSAMRWVKKNIPSEEHVWVITGNPSLFVDPILEWFPALSEHQSISTIQGREWVKGDEFFSYAEKIQSAQKCYWQDATCLENDLVFLPAFDYLFLPKHCTGEPDCTGDLAERVSPLYFSLLHSNFPVVYENDGVIIFASKEK